MQEILNQLIGRTIENVSCRIVCNVAKEEVADTEITLYFDDGSQARISVDPNNHGDDDGLTIEFDN